MIPFVRIALLVLGGAVLLSGCGGKKLDAPKPTIVAFPKGNQSDGTNREPRLIGRVTLVNEEGRFALIHCDAWVPPAPGTAVKCLRGGQESAVLTVGSERRGAYVTADFVTGKPQRYDQVFQ
jgi:hypothetical protein